MKSSLKRGGLGLGVSDDPTALRPSLADCLETVLKRSNGLFDRMLDGLAVSVDRAKSMKGGADTPPQVKLAIEHLLGARAEVREQFHRQLRKGMYGGVVQDGGPQPLLRFEDLQLLDEQQLDENIELARAQQEVSVAVDDVLPQLDALMSTMLGWITVQSHLNPLRPEVFVRAARDAVAGQVDDPQVREMLLAPMAGKMGSDLRRVYQETGAWLASFGVEPAGLPAPSASPGAPAANPGGSAVAKTLLTLDRLRKLLSGELDGENGAIGMAGRGLPQDFLHTIPASIEALQDMQQVEAMVQRLAQKAREAAKSPNPPPKKRLPTDRRQLGQQLGEEVARMMFENLTQDERLLPAVKDVLISLEPLLLQLTRTDSQFFSDRQHPARQYLDRLIHRSLAFSSERDEGFARFLKGVTAATAVLLGRTGDQVVPAFGEILQKLEQVWARDDEVLKQKQEEAARALLHAEQRNLLAQRHALDFRSRLEGKDISQVVQDFLVSVWSQAVAESQLSCTDGTSDPHGLLGIVDDLIWSVQHKVARRNRQKLVQMIPGLLGRLRQGLQLIGYPPERIAVFFDELIAVHEAALEEGRVRPAPAPARDDTQDDTGVEVNEITESVWLAENEATESGFLDEEAAMPLDPTSASLAGDVGPDPLLAPDLTPGTWAQLMVEGTWVRAQLTWVSPHKTLFMFTSASGSAHSMSNRTLERLLSQGLVRVISDGHMVDDALDAIAQAALRNTLAPGSQPEDPHD